MATFYKILVTVKSVNGKCDAGLKVGDTFEIVGPKLIQGGICIPALGAIYPYVNAMKYGEPYFLEGKEAYEGCCPDPKNPVIFEISRVKMNEDRPSFG